MDKCELFQKISSDTWDIISKNHSRDNRLSEEGITRQTIISSIQDNFLDNRQFDVFAQKAKDEVNTGADLELFIQSSPYRFVRILLQAKIMETNCVFEQLDRNSGSTGRKQFDSLIGYSKLVSAKSYYLFFNGIYNFNANGLIDCAGEHNEKQYGCSILKSEKVKKHCLEKKTGIYGDVNNPTPVGDPWRLLACCNQNDNAKFKAYNFEEIDADPIFNNVFTSPTISFITPGNLGSETNIERANSIIHNNGWNPFARIFLTTGGNKMTFRDGLLSIVS